ncbi:hypothetical protein IFR05_001955 [Cadophora sp. M221]|nr:hypothetical protein IFR05_001955 [Cadophora sp. M221]
MLQTTSKQDLDDLLRRCASLSVEALEQNPELTSHIKTIEAEYVRTQIDNSTYIVFDIIAVLPGEEFHYGCQIYLQDRVTSQFPASSLYRIASLNTLNNWVLPVLPAHITNISCYRFTPVTSV